MTHELPTERVLSTLNRDGTRRWIHPKVARGRFLTRRRIVAYALIVLYVVLPRLRFAGRPAFKLDLAARELDFLGSVFRPSDGFGLALLGVSVALAVFLVTALWGRVWCGWGCPQSVYLEHVFRPIERWLMGSRGQRASLPRRAVKWLVFAALSFALANVFLAYFVGTDELWRWVLESPLQHPAGFSLVVVVSGLMLFDFGWFREQMCIVTCPYGRLQSVLLDRQSLIVGYDRRRGEPRGKAKNKLPIASTGDCVDCVACVSVCPTGIDIREGLQMECVGCAQCIDACDGVMDKLGRKRGLIRYTSQDELAGRPRKLWRARTIIYPSLLLIAATSLIALLVRRDGNEVWIERMRDASFAILPDGRVSAPVLVKVENESDAVRDYRVELVEAGDAELQLAQPTWQVRPHSSIVIPVIVDAPRTSFVHGERRVRLQISDGGGSSKRLDATLLGPEAGAP